MSLQEVQDTVNSRIRQKSDDIYTLSGMIRVAVLSVFSDKVQFPDAPAHEKEQGDWKNSKKYFKALQEYEKEVHKWE